MLIVQVDDIGFESLERALRGLLYVLWLTTEINARKGINVDPKLGGNH